MLWNTLRQYRADFFHVTFLGFFSKLIVHGHYTNVNVDAMWLHLGLGWNLDHWVDIASCGDLGALSDTRFHSKLIHITDFRRLNKAAHLKRVIITNAHSSLHHISLLIFPWLIYDSSILFDDIVVT